MTKEINKKFTYFFGSEQFIISLIEPIIMNLLSLNCHFKYPKYKNLFCQNPKKVGSY